MSEMPDTIVQPPLRTLEQRLRLRPHHGPLSTALGKVWAQRRKIADRYYEANAYDFDELLDLYTNAEELREKWHSNVGMAWSVLQNLVADSFFKNPEPVILPLTPDREEQARMLADLGRTWHETAGTEENVSRARTLCGLQGGAVIWVEEEGQYEDALALDEDGRPLYQQVDEAGNPVFQPDGTPMMSDQGVPLYELDRPYSEGGEPLQEAINQEFTQTLIDMHGWRVDPDCRRWDHRDAKWVERRYTRTLQDFLDDGAFSDEAKSMLIRWAKQRDDRWRGNMARAYGREGFDEQDPALILLECGEIWSMVHGKILHMPVGAEFHLSGATEETRDGFPMPWFWRERKMYPGVMFAYNWHPPDRWGKKGYYPIPDLRLIKSRLKNLNRLEALILNLCTQQTQKYFAPEGLVDNKVQRRIASDVPREIIPVDVYGVVKRLAALGVNVPSLDHLIVNLKTEQREQLIKHFEAFAHEVNLIRETLSQGAAQRGGVTDANTATGQMQIGQALERRLDIESERTSAYIDQLTERYFMLLQARSTLPVYYKDTGSQTASFRPFVADQGFRDTKLSFTHRTGTARGVDREMLRSQIREAITNALPVVQDPVQIQTLLRKLFQTFDDPTLTQAFDNDLSSLAEEAAVALQQFEAGQIPADQYGAMASEFLSIFIQAHLTQAGVDRAAQKAAGMPAPLPAGERSASLAKPKSAGKRAFDTAAGLASAGRVGGMGVN